MLQLKIGSAVAILWCALVLPVYGQSGESPQANTTARKPVRAVHRAGRRVFFDSGDRLNHSLARDIFDDQKAIWSSPAHLRVQHLDWLIPAAGLTAGLLVTDRDFNAHLSVSTQARQKYARDSDYALGGMAGIAGGLYLLGKLSDDAHKRETGLLSGEAAADALGVTYGLKYALGRARPLSHGGQGSFFSAGDSFPSAHAAIAWSVASVLAHEYPGPMTKILAYGAASAISVARIRAKEHFPSDVVIGAGLGWLVGDYVYRRRHQTAWDGGSWGTMTGLSGSEARTPGAMGSPYVPLDSWAYALFDRLIAMGYIDDAIMGMRPWTRLECARLLANAASDAEEYSGDSGGANLIAELNREFGAEINLLGGGSNRSIHLESLYSRFTEISGPTLADGAHFGQTFFNDFGRPYHQGLNNVTGISGWAVAGRWVVYLRGEYQHAPSWPGYSPAVQNEIAFLDENTGGPAITGGARNQARLLDTYIGLNLGNWQFSYGQQSQWWGPGASGPLLFSNNASPVRMFHIDRVSPFFLPGILKYLGPMRWNAFFGDLQGLPFSPGPVFHGEKISFKPTANLELGFTRTVVFAGQDRALTLNRLFRSYFSVTSSINENAATDPGKRMGGFDFQYRIPYVRKWLTLYMDSIAADDPSPLASPSRSGFSPGIYMPQIPKLPKLDFRVEAANTKIDQVHFSNGHFLYWDGRYHQVYTNRGNLMSTAAGLDGTEILAQSRLWLGARNSLRFAYRHAKVDTRYIPNGGTINDASVRAEFWLNPAFGATAIVQAERWKFPLLASGTHQNISVSVQFTYWPSRNPSKEQSATSLQ